MRNGLLASAAVLFASIAMALDKIIAVIAV